MAGNMSYCKARLLVFDWLVEEGFKPLYPYSQTWVRNGVEKVVCGRDAVVRSAYFPMLDECGDDHGYWAPVTTERYEEFALKLR